MKQAKTNYIYGKHPIILALKHYPSVISELQLEKGMTLPQELDDICHKHKIRKVILNPGMLPREITDEATHQGMVASINTERIMVSWEDFVEDLEVSADSCIVLAANIQDPHNTGAIIRSAGAFGAAAVLIPDHHQSPVNGTVVKVSAGMAFTVPLVQIGNINNALRILKERGFWVYGLDGQSKQTIHTEKFDAPAVFVLGNEGEGIKEKTKELCDITLSIPMHTRCESLNVAASTAVVLNEWSQQHPQAITS